MISEVLSYDTNLVYLDEILGEEKGFSLKQHEERERETNKEQNEHKHFQDEATILVDPDKRIENDRKLFY